MYNPELFDKAIQGCEFVFHLATPYHHALIEGYQYNNRVEATTGAVKSVVKSCIRAGTVKRLIYTASVVATSPLKDDGTGFKDSIDETCRTPYSRFFEESKTLAEKEILSQENDESSGIEVFLEDLLGKVPIVLIEDVCEAHIFCLEAPFSINGGDSCVLDC
ncbi:hypothetical protein LguiA_019034 [Lonicera macranthoides]